MTVEELLTVLEMQEEVLQFNHFTNRDAWELGSMMAHEALKRNRSVSISIRLNNGYTVFQYAADGTNLADERWMVRKCNTVKVKEMSSLRAYTMLRAEGATLADWYMDPSEFAVLGGGFPIRVEEVGVIGAIVVSGLDHFEDHDLIVKCVSKYLHIDEVPRIRGNF